MKEKIVMIVVAMFLLIANGSLVLAQEETSATTTETAAAESGTGWKQEISGDRQVVAEQWDVLKEHGQEARAEQRQLQQQIFDAVKSGDYETAKSLREQLKTMHQENIAQKKDDLQALRETRQELKGDIKQAKEAGAMPPLKRPKPQNPPGYNPPGAGPENPPGYNPPGAGPVSPKVKDRVEDVRDRREDIRDRREDIRDRKEDVLDRREDIWDATHNPPPGTEAYRRDKLEDIRDRREDVRDRKEDVKDRREDVRDRREDIRDKKNIHDRGLQGGHDNIGIKDRGKGIGAGKGQGGVHRSGGAPKRR